MLRKLTLNCNLRVFLDEGLRERFVCGLINSSIRRQLLAERTLKLQERTLTLKKAINFAETLESAEVEKKLIKKITADNAFTIEQKSQSCYQCNSNEHLADTCPLKEYVCNTCKMKGHLSKAHLER